MGAGTGRSRVRSFCRTGNQGRLLHWVRLPSQPGGIRTAGGVAHPPYESARVIPKPHQPGKWRLIKDLSFSKGESVNDGIGSELCSVSYAKVDDGVTCINTLGRGLSLTPIGRSQFTQQLLGSDMLVNGALSFGHWSAPKLFMAVADTLLWVIGRKNVMHYLDDPYTWPLEHLGM